MDGKKKGKKEGKKEKRLTVSSTVQRVWSREEEVDEVPRSVEAERP